MTEGETLKACPFCGGEAEMQPWHGGGPDKQLIGCSDPDGLCIARPSVTGETPAEAIAAWNTRPAPDSGDRNAVLEAIVTDICELPGDDDPEADDTLILSLDDLRVILERNLSTPEPVPDDRDAEIERLKADIATLQDANFRQANCIHLTAQALGPENQSARRSKDVEAQGRDAPSFVTYRLSRDEILSEAILGLRSDISKIMEQQIVRTQKECPNAPYIPLRVETAECILAALRNQSPDRGEG